MSATTFYNQCLEFSKIKDYTQIVQLLTSITDPNIQLQLKNCIKEILYDFTNLYAFENITIFNFSNLERLDIPLIINNEADLELISRHSKLRWLILMTKNITFSPPVILRQLWRENNRDLSKTYIRHLTDHYGEIVEISEVEGDQLRTGYSFDNFVPKNLKYMDGLFGIDTLIGKDIYSLDVSKKYRCWDTFAADSLDSPENSSKLKELKLLFCHSLSTNDTRKKINRELHSPIYESMPNLEILTWPLKLRKHNYREELIDILPLIPNVKVVHLFPTENFDAKILKDIGRLITKNFVLLIFPMDEPYYNKIRFPSNGGYSVIRTHYFDSKEYYNLDTRIGDIK